MSDCDRFTGQSSPPTDNVSFVSVSTRKGDTGDMMPGKFLPSRSQKIIWCWGAELPCFTWQREKERT